MNDLRSCSNKIKGLNKPDQTLKESLVEGNINILLENDDLMILSIEANAAATIPTVDNNRGVVDCGATKSVFMSVMNMTNKQCTRASIGGISEQSIELSVVKGTRADLQGIAMPGARHNLLATDDLMDVMNCNILLTKDGAEFIDIVHAQAWLDKIKKSGKIIRSAGKDSNGLITMDIPKSFRRDVDYPTLEALSFNISELGSSVTPSLTIEDPDESLGKRLDECRIEFEATVAAATARQNQAIQELEALIARQDEEIDEATTALKMFNFEEQDLVFYRDGSFRNIHGNKREKPEHNKELSMDTLYMLKAHSIVDDDTFQRVHKILCHSKRVHQLNGKVRWPAGKPVKIGRKRIRQHYSGCTCCSLVTDKKPDITKGHDDDRDTKPTGPLQTIWLDAMEKQGPVGVLGFNFFWIIIDEFSKYVWLLATKDKSDDGDFGLQWRLWLKEYNRNKTIQFVHHDCDGTLRSPAFKQICLLNGGIISVPTPSRQHFLNGQIERPIGTLRTMANAIRSNHQVPNFLQYFAVLFAVDAFNKIPHVVNGVLQEKTPYELMHGSQPDLDTSHSLFATRIFTKAIKRMRKLVLLSFVDTVKKREEKDVTM